LTTDHAPEGAAGASRGWRGRLVLLAALALIVAAFFLLHGERYVSLETVKANRDALLAFTHGALFRCARHCVRCLRARHDAEPARGAGALADGGFLFGRWIGTVLVVTAATIGATLLFLAARYLFADAARRRMGALGEKLNAGFTENALNYLLFLRLVPLFPFFLVNLAPAFTTIPLRTFILARFWESFRQLRVRKPRETLGRIDSLSGLLSTPTIAAFVLLGALALVPVLVARYVRAERRKRDALHWQDPSD
jgi:hypothetical protein